MTPRGEERIPRELWESLIDAANASTERGTVGDYRAKAVVFSPDGPDGIDGIVAYGNDLLLLTDAQGLALNLSPAPVDRVFTVSREWTHGSFEVHELDRDQLAWRRTEPVDEPLSLPERPPFRPGSRSRPSVLAERLQTPESRQESRGTCSVSLVLLPSGSDTVRSLAVPRA